MPVLEFSSSVSRNSTLKIKLSNILWFYVLKTSILLLLLGDWITCRGKRDLVQYKHKKPNINIVITSNNLNIVTLEENPVY